MSWSFALSVRADERMLGTVRAVAVGAARRAQYASDEAEGIGRAVAEAAAQIVAAAGGPTDFVDLVFAVEGGRFETRLRYVAATERLPIASDGMDSVEFGRDGDFAVCTLARRLP